MKKTSQTSSEQEKPEQEKPEQEIIMIKSLEIEAESNMTNEKSTAPVKADSSKIKPEIKKETMASAKAKKTVSENNKKATATTKPSAAKTKAVVKPKAAATKSQTTPKAKRSRTRPGASTSSKVKAPAKTKLSKKQSAKDLLSNQDNDVPDLNAGTGYPMHPNRIWPD